SEPGRRPQPVEHHLAVPELHADAVRFSEERPPARDGDQHIEREPDRAEHPVRRVERWLLQTDVPLAWGSRYSDEGTDTDDDSEKHPEENQGAGGLEIGDCQGAHAASNDGWRQKVSPHGDAHRAATRASAQ